MNWNTWSHQQLDALRAASRYRQLEPFEGAGQLGLVRGESYISFASNDYLGLSNHPRVRDAVIDAVSQFGVGSGASRLVTGTRHLHQELEALIAHWQRSANALVFPTGYAANLAALSVFGGEDAIVFSDELNHASIIDGCRLSRSRIETYRHCDIEHLASRMALHASRKLVVSDVIFSMDGDLAPIEELAALCAQHNALLILDEAHAVLQEVHDLPCEVLRVGTLSKTLGSLGGWIAGSQAMIQLLINKARSFIFTTGLSIADTAAALAALHICLADEGVALRNTLQQHIDNFRPGHPSPIVPLIFGDEAIALAASQQLKDRHLLVPAIRPPSVPIGTSRLRIVLSAAHSKEMLQQLTDALASLPCKPLDLKH